MDSGIRINNIQSEDVTFILEPWGEQYLMPAEAKYHLFMNRPTRDGIDIEFGDHRIIVWCTISVRLLIESEGQLEELGTGLRPRAAPPATPAKKPATNTEGLK